MPGNTLTRTVCAGALWTVMAAGALSQSANAPLSAIDWLSDSITLPDPVPPQAAMPSPSASAPEVLVAPLDAPVPDRAGLIPARSMGLPADLWGGSSAADLARRISAMPEIGTPTLRRFFRCKAPDGGSNSIPSSSA